MPTGPSHSPSDASGQPAPFDTARPPGGPASIVERILGMYRKGWFPMADPRTREIEWFQPRRRGVIPLEPGGFVIPRSLRQRVRSGRFEVRCDTAFREVITACSLPRPQEDSSWIDARIIEAYCLLHESGHAHSIEAWLPSSGASPRLVGGLYGVHIGGVFFGESMFSRPAEGGTDASKVCLVHLVHHMRRRGMTLLDTQLWNEHLSQFGCREVPHARFLAALAPALDLAREWQPFEPARTIPELAATPATSPPGT